MDDLAAFEALFRDGEDPAEVLERRNRHRARVRSLAEALSGGSLDSIGTDGASIDRFRDG
jgi:hypothetical protein